MSPEAEFLEAVLANQKAELGARIAELEVLVAAAENEQSFSACRKLCLSSRNGFGEALSAFAETPEEFLRSEEYGLLDDLLDRGVEAAEKCNAQEGLGSTSSNQDKDLKHYRCSIAKRHELLGVMADDTLEIPVRVKTIRAELRKWHAKDGDLRTSADGAGL